MTAERDIAVIGMAGRFPGAADVDAFWANLRDGGSGITHFETEELEAAGVDPAALRDPAYVKARGVLDGPDLFDAEFFDMPPREAATTDPQHRIFLECAAAALEDAGFDPRTFPGSIGVYGGVGMSGYVLELLADAEVRRAVAPLQLMLGNDKDFAMTRVSYKLDLRGPSLSVQTACSTSLVAVHLACEALLDYECDIALAGGASVDVRPGGYFYEVGGIYSPDGHCRAFDARAQGCVPGDGAAVVVLCRLADALAEGATIRAVVKGSATNNDGALKAGFTAPSVEGQAAVVAQALEVADMDARTVSYVEAHGTATPLGDPVEVAALTKAFRAWTPDSGFCALGSVKTNVGHLDTAAGAAGLIKTVLALEHGLLPPSLDFEEPNPQIDFDGSPFYVNDCLRPWVVNGAPRRAGVTSLGMGGTNVHVVLEQAPEPRPSGPSRQWQLLALSAKRRGDLDALGAGLDDRLAEHPELELPDVAHTLRVGRRALAHRRVAVCAADGGRDALSALSQQTLDTEVREPGSVAFMFPGQGAQRPGAARELYETEPLFRAELDGCAEAFRRHLGIDMHSLLYGGAADAAGELLRETRVSQPVLFALEYALARLWLSWGVEPDALIGHSVGEWVAACVAGVFSLDDAVRLVADRASLMQSLPRGAMLAVQLGEEELLTRLPPELDLAAVNGASACTISGPPDAVAAFAQSLAEDGVGSRRLHTSHAFHSRAVDPVVELFTAKVAGVARSKPAIPVVANVTGTWLTDDDALDPSYWARHLRRPVRFADGLQTLLREPRRALLEVGPGHTLCSLARRAPGDGDGRTIVPSLARPGHGGSDARTVVESLGRLWLAGVEVDWVAFAAHEDRRRVRLPVYPYERRRHRVGAPPEKVGTRRVARRPVAQSPPAADGLATAVAQVWERVLGVSDLSLDADFFELGGDSLLGVQTVTLLRDELAVDLLPEDLVAAPTVRELAARIEERRAGGRGGPGVVAVPLQPRGGEQPLFLVHPVGGHVLCYAELARAIGPEHPVYGLRHPALGGRVAPLATVEELAALYVDEIRSVRPEGPRRLAGWSFGGVVAFEIARQLEGHGEDVTALVLVDAVAPGSEIGGAEASEQELWQLFLRDAVRVSGEEGTEAGAGDETALRAAAARALGPADVEPFYAVFRANVAALERYRPDSPAAADALLVEAGAGGEGVTATWRRLLAGDVHVERVAGDHYTLLTKPSVAKLAATIRGFVAERSGSTVQEVAHG